MNRNSPSWLVRQDSGWCFRMVVPLDLQPIVGKKEIRYSLRTGFLGEAKYMARRMAGETLNLFRRLRKGGTMTDAEIRRLMADVLRETLEADEQSRVDLENIPTDEKQTPQEALKEHAELKGLFQTELQFGDYDDTEDVLKNVFEQKELAVPEKSETFTRLCREMAKVMVTYLSIAEKRDSGDYHFETALLQKAQPTLNPVTQEKPSEGLFKVVDRYVEEQEKGKCWTTKSTVEYTACLNLMKDFFGDIPVKSIDHAKMRKYKEALMKLPPNMKKSPLYRDLSLAEILKMDIEKTWATPTINKYLNRASCLFEFAMNNVFMDKNPARGMEISISKRNDEQRSVFTTEDLTKLFCSPEYMEDTHKQSYYFWTPILALFTGCRQNEIAQLSLEDIKEVDGVWIFDINSREDKRTKNAPSKRLVPIHPFLLDDLKIVDYAEHLKRQGEQQLFPELKRTSDGHGKLVSKWFNERYKVKCGVTATNDERKDFHSFRHTFINALKQNRAEGTMLAELVGHEVDSMTMGTYGKRYAPRVLLEEVLMKLRYDLDLSHLKKSRFVSSI